MQIWCLNYLSAFQINFQNLLEYPTIFLYSQCMCRSLKDTIENLVVKETQFSSFQNMMTFFFSLEKSLWRIELYDEERATKFIPSFTKLL